jgi:hypothetical protein
MRKWLWGLSAWALLGLLAFWGGGQGRLRPGDTVTPYLDASIQWTAGRPGGLWVRLQARGADKTASRTLGADALPYGVNPVADITFHQGEYESLGSIRVPLSHRC